MKKIITPLALLLLCSCAAPRLTTGRYTIKGINGHDVAFVEVPGWYNIQSDTLKIGDKITINVIKRKQ